MTATVIACGGGSDPSGPSCGTGIGLGNPACPCVSWTYEVEVWDGCCCSDCVRVSADTAASPARIRLRVGQKVMLASSIDRAEPDRCNQGWDSRPTWIVTAPSVLQLVSVQPASVSTAVFLATAPGTTTVLAELRSASGTPERVGLSVCVEERATVWTDECLKRVPLEIDVVP